MVENIKNKAVTGVVWSFVEQFAGQLIQFVISIILARILVPTDYGLIGMLGFFMAISNVFIDGGFSSALIQKQDRKDSDLNTVFYINIGISTICYIILAVFAPCIAEFFKQSQLTSIIRVYCLTLVIGGLSGINTTLLTINVDFKTKSKISISSAILSGIIGIICAYKGLGVWALVIQALSSGIITLILNFYFVRWFPKLEFSIKSFKILFSYGSKLLASSLIASAYTNVYSLVIGKQFESSILGYFSRAQGFTNLTSNNVNNILSRVSFPILSKVQDNDETLLRIYEKYIQMSAFIIFPIVLLLCGISHPLVISLLTEKWAPCIGLLRILCFSCLWNGIIDINLNLLKVKGRTDLVLKLEIIKKIIAVLILIVSVLFDNIYAICLGLALYSFIALYLNTLYSKRILDLGFLRQFRLFFPYLFLSLFTMGVAFLISYLIPSLILALVGSLIVCPVIYIISAKMFHLYALSECTNIIKGLILKK